MHLRPTQHCFTGKSSSILRLVPNGFSSRPSPLNAFFFSYQKSAAFLFFLSDSNLCCSWSFMLNELENQCITHVNLPLLVLTSLNRGLTTTSPAIHLCWVCSLNAEAVSFLRFPSFILFYLLFLASILASLVWKYLTVGWMNSASAAGQKGNVIYLRKLPCFSAGLFFCFGSLKKKRTLHYF